MALSGRVSVTGVRPAIRFASAISLLAAAFALSPLSAPVTADAVAAAADGSAGGAVAGARTKADPDYWTTERMLAASPVEPPVGTTTPPAPGLRLTQPAPGAQVSAATGDFRPVGTKSFPLRVHGKVFLRIGDDDFVCSGTVVHSKGENVVLTAGHCVFDNESGLYAEQLVFVPAFRDGSTPFGIWPASAVFTTNRFVQRGSPSHDIGAVVLERRIQRELGARRITFGLDPGGRSYTIYGYPEEPRPRYDGGSLAGCRSTTRGRDTAQGSPAPIAAGPCLMGQGSSGGAWITGGGLLASVVSYGYCENLPDLCGLTFGPHFRDQALDLYTFPAVGGSKAPTVRIRTGPPRRLSGRRAKFRFSGSGSTPVSFRCSLDRRAPFRCGRKTTLRRLDTGPHVLRVRAVDQTGKASRKAVTRSFRVLRRGR